MTGRHRRVSRRRRDWVVDALVVWVGLCGAFTHQRGGDIPAPRMMFLIWVVLVLARFNPDLRPGIIRSCRWLRTFSATMFVATLQLALPTNNMLWLNTSVEFATVSAACASTAWALRPRLVVRAKHAI
jgi:hypothetical protein